MQYIIIKENYKGFFAMKKIRWCAVGLLICAVCISQAMAGGLDTTVSNSNKEEREYLGISENQTDFILRDIDAEFLIVEIFSMYCSVCQKKAELVNNLYEKIENKGLHDKIKIIGVGYTNSQFEVTLYKGKFKVPFPLFSDPDGSITAAFGAQNTPHFFIFKRTASGHWTEVVNVLNQYDEVKTYVNDILEGGN